MFELLYGEQRSQTIKEKVGFVINLFSFVQVFINNGRMNKKWHRMYFEVKTFS
jgi:hypothetical protein